jgi:hypothetical protein
MGQIVVLDENMINMIAEKGLQILALIGGSHTPPVSAPHNEHLVRSVCQDCLNAYKKIC